MDAREPSRQLCWHGALLFMLGLLIGGLVATFANPRMGLSAHLAAVQNGMFLLIAGLLWPRLQLEAGRERAARVVGIASMYAISSALLLSAAFGTSGATPIAGAGFAGAQWQEWLVTGLLYSGSAAIIFATALILHGLRRPAVSS